MRILQKLHELEWLELLLSCFCEVRKKLGGDTHDWLPWIPALSYIHNEAQLKLSFTCFPSKAIIHLRFI